MRIIDLSMPVFSGMPVFPGDPVVSITPETTLSESDYRVSQIRFGSHTGTHIDAPSHFLPDGETVSDVDLLRFVGEAVCLRASVTEESRDNKRIIGLSAAQRQLIRTGGRILLSTGWEAMAGTEEYFRDYPLFSEELIEFLLEKQLVLLGADLPTLAGREDPFRLHREMLSGGTVFVEGLVQTGDLPEKSFFFSAAPLKISNGDGSPVRAYAIVE